MSPKFTIYKAGTSLIKVVIRKCVFTCNERADSSAKSALDLPHAKVGVPYNDFKHCINQNILSTWQDDWNGAVVNKLHSVKPVLGDWQSSYRRCRKDEVVLCRTRIEHTHLTNSYISRKDHLTHCEHRQCIQKRKDIFGRRHVLVSLIFHPTLILLF